MSPPSTGESETGMVAVTAPSAPIRVRMTAAPGSNAGDQGVEGALAAIVPSLTRTFDDLQRPQTRLLEQQVDLDQIVGEAGFEQRDMGGERTGARGVIQFHRIFPSR